MYSRNRKHRTLGQTALEYTLVIGVIVVGAIFAGKKLFGTTDPNKPSVAESIMHEALDSARGTITPGK